MAAEEKVIDPACGMEIDPEKAPVSIEWEGKKYYFCCEGCLQRFLAEKQAAQ